VARQFQLGDGITVHFIRAVSQTGERMPAKSTYFYPKLASGLVFNPLE
jgi:uncharacterized protein (DUF1015 family)